jgi:hypothetical protein
VRAVVATLGYVLSPDGKRVRTVRER